MRTDRHTSIKHIETDTQKQKTFIETHKYRTHTDKHTNIEHIQAYTQTNKTVTTMLLLAEFAQTKTQNKLTIISIS